MKITDALKKLWCGYTHGGGHITRDPSGRINWRCCKCGRWAVPVELAEERKMVDSAIKKAASMRQTNHAKAD